MIVFLNDNLKKCVFSTLIVFEVFFSENPQLFQHHPTRTSAKQSLS